MWIWEVYMHEIIIPVQWLSSPSLTLKTDFEFVKIIFPIWEWNAFWENPRQLHKLCYHASVSPYYCPLSYELYD